MSARRVGVGGGAAAVLLLASLTACSPPAPAFDDVTVLVYQPRPDVAAGRFAVQVTNGGAEAIEVTAARLSSPDFADAAVWSGDSATVLPGRAVDLRTDLPAFDCGRDSDPVAELELVGTRGSVRAEFAVDDPYDLLPRLRAEGCVGLRIAELAVVTPREVVVGGAGDPAVLVLDLEPTGAEGEVELVAVQGTTLLQPAADGVSVPRLPLGVRIAADGPREVRIPFVPNRCDAHALAEDKVGTIIPILVDAGDGPVRWLVVLPDALRGTFYDFYAATCGLPAP